MIIQQGSPEWYAERCGLVTASRIADVIARVKSGWGASRANYAAQLVAERLTGRIEDRYVSPEMRWGTETEPLARAAYAFITDEHVEEVGFVRHPAIEMAGASPDGLVGADGLVEFKCPNTSTHIDTLLGVGLPDKYYVQMQWQMVCTDRAWTDFVSFDPRLPESMRLFIRRVYRDEKRIAELESVVRGFLAEVDRIVTQLQELYGHAEAA